MVNSVTPINRAAPHLKRVVLVTGTKYYGVHLGPLKTPMRETDPRHMPPNYYFDQIDWLTAYQRGKEWDWVELRPQTLCGFSPGSPMSILPAIAVYAAISRELGLPLRFPGKPGAFDTIYQVTESLQMQRCGQRRINGAEIKPSTLLMATISDGGIFGPRSQQSSKWQLQSHKQFASRNIWSIRVHSGRKLPPSTSSSGSPTRISSLGHLRITCLVLTGM
jgi:hypothetical protein